MIKTTLQSIAVTTAVLILSSCIVTPEQAADIELLHKIYGMTVQIGGGK